jgi:hypothetical protein
VEGAIAREFSGRPADLRQTAETLGGRPPSIAYRYDISLVILALPKVPLLLLFNDADDEFPAACSVLFERRAERYLDMECLAMVGMLFADYLLKKLQSWLGKICKLDFYGATLAAEAKKRLRDCEALLETYAQRVFEVHDENH